MRRMDTRDRTSVCLPSTQAALLPSKTQVGLHLNPGVKSPKNYGFEISPGGYQRRINKDGMHMLEAILEKRETDKQVSRG